MEPTSLLSVSALVMPTQSIDMCKLSKALAHCRASRKCPQLAGSDDGREWHAGSHLGCGGWPLLHAGLPVHRSHHPMSQGAPFLPCPALLVPLRPTIFQLADLPPYGLFADNFMCCSRPTWYRRARGTCTVHSKS